MFRSTIPVVDLASGRLSDRPSDTLTLDVPPDFDRSVGVASVDKNACAHYLSTGGSTLSHIVHPRPLSWRVRGEECLVAKAKGSTNEISYRLCAIDPSSEGAMRSRARKTT